MFWKLPTLSPSSPVESILEKDSFTLEELLDEEEIIQECKAMNSRLINFLWDSTQVEQLLRYIVEEPLEDAESKRVFKFPFIACEIFVCEIDVILKTLVEEEELMNLLFSFLEPNRPHSAALAGYFSKVVICLMVRKTGHLMDYVQVHDDIFRKLVDLIGITSIMEVLVRLVGGDGHVYPNFIDVMQWLSESNLLEMMVDKLSPSNPSEVHANAAETLCTIARNAPSALATKLFSPSFVVSIFDHILEDSPSKSSLVHSLSVCISLLDPKRSTTYPPLFQSFRNQHMYEYPILVDPETIGAMLPKLGDLVMLLGVSSDEKILPTTYGELRPPLGKHRLKIVEFIAVLLKTGNDEAEKELVSTGTIKRVIDLFFGYPYNNLLHHHVESIIFSCLESKSDAIVHHLLRDCSLIERFVCTDKKPVVLVDTNKPTVLASEEKSPRAGNIGHITQISNKLVQMGNSESRIRKCLQENVEWNDWLATVLEERNAVENVHRWACGRPTALHDRTRESDEDDLNDRDYDVAALANNLSQAFRYKIYGNEDAEEDPGTLDRDDEDVYFDDESAEVVIPSLRLGDDQGSNLFTNSDWFAFQDIRIGSTPVGTSASDMMDDINLIESPNKGGNSSSDDEVMVGEEEEMAWTKHSVTEPSNSGPTNIPNGSSCPDEPGAMHNFDFFQFQTTDKEESFGDDRPSQVGGSCTNPFEDHEEPILSSGSPISTDSSEGSMGSVTSQRTVPVPSLFEEDVEFVGVELEGTEKAMDQALKEGIVGEAGPLKRNINTKVPEKESSDEGRAGIKEFNDTNYWRVDQEVAILE